MATWVAYDAVSGDVLDEGPEGYIRALLARTDKDTRGQHTMVICASGDWHRLTEPQRRAMSGNPPRRKPQR